MDELPEIDLFASAETFLDDLDRIRETYMGDTPQQRASNYMFGGQEARQLHDEAAFYRRPILFDPTNADIPLTLEGEKNMYTERPEIESYTPAVRYRSYREQPCDFDPGFKVMARWGHRTDTKDDFLRNQSWSVRCKMTEREDGMLEITHPGEDWKVIGVPTTIEAEFKSFRQTSDANERSQQIATIFFDAYYNLDCYSPVSKLGCNLRNAVLFLGAGNTVSYLGDMDWQLVALTSLGISTADSTKVAWANRLEDIENEGRRSQSSMFKFLQKLRYKTEGKTENFQFEDEVLQDFATRVGIRLAEESAEFEFEVVHGADVVKTYNEEYFGSCMSSHSDYYKGQTDLYMHNPEKVGSLRISKNGNLKGRALVWYTDQGMTFMDRVYPSDGGAHVKAAVKYAKEKGWDYRSTSGYEPASGNDYTATLLDSGDYPYMDTFDKATAPFNENGKRYFKVATCGSMLRSSTYYDSCTTGGQAYWEDEESTMYCEYMDAYYNDEDMVYVHDVNTYVSEDALERYFTRIRGEWYYIEGDSVAFDDISGDYFLSDYAVTTFDGETTRQSRVVTLTHGEYEGEFIHEDDERLVKDDEGNRYLTSDTVEINEKQGELFD